MKREQPKLNVTLHGELDLSKLPKDIFNALVAALVEEISELMEKDKNK